MTIIAPDVRQWRGISLATSTETIITPQVLRGATDWQAEIAAECRRLRKLTPEVFTFLKRTGLIQRCTFLATDDDGGPLRFCYIGQPSLDRLGRAWGRSMIGHPINDDPNAEFAGSVAAQYGAAITSGELLLNRVEVHGIGQGFAYTHLLIGWEDRGRRAVLSAIELAPRAQ